MFSVRYFLFFDDVFPSSKCLRRLFRPVFLSARFFSRASSRSLLSPKLYSGSFFATGAAPSVACGPLLMEGVDEVLEPLLVGGTPCDFSQYMYPDPPKMLMSPKMMSIIPKTFLLLCGGVSSIVCVGRSLPVVSMRPGSWFCASCVMQVLPEQMPVSQSLLFSHPPPSGHAGQFGPPQSTPVSPWFCLPSVQLGAWHCPLRQTFDAQSRCDSHV